MSSLQIRIFTKNTTMARVAGITTEKDVKGNITKVTFDFKKYGTELMPLLLKTGAVEEDSFEKEWAEAQKTGYSVEAAFVELEKRIEKRWESRK